MNPADDLTKRVPFIACQADARCSYCLYVPETIHHVLVYVHGTERDATFCRDHLADFAEANNVLVVAPLFPAGLIDPMDMDNYKYSRFHDIRFDQILLAMLAEISGHYDLPVDRFLIVGFSGGAQFAHRFSYFYGDRLHGVSIAAPGRVTLLDARYKWWPGIHDVEELFGQPVQTDALHHLRVHLIVGGDDRDDITIKSGSPYWADGANLAGTTRRQRLGALATQYRQLKANVLVDIIFDCDHVWLPLKQATCSFFETIIRDLP